MGKVTSLQGGMNDIVDPTLLPDTHGQYIEGELDTGIISSSQPTPRYVAFENYDKSDKDAQGKYKNSSRKLGDVIVIEGEEEDTVYGFGEESNLSHMHYDKEELFTAEGYVPSSISNKQEEGLIRPLGIKPYVLEDIYKEFNLRLNPVGELMEGSPREYRFTYYNKYYNIESVPSDVLVEIEEEKDSIQELYLQIPHKKVKVKDIYLKEVSKRGVLGVSVYIGGMFYKTNQYSNGYVIDAIAINRGKTDVEDYYSLKFLADGEIGFKEGKIELAIPSGKFHTAEFNNPSGITADNVRYVYVTDRNNNALRRLDTLNSNTTTTISTGFNAPTGLVIDHAKKYLYIADTGSNSIKRLDITTNNIITIGTGFNTPTRLVIDSTGKYLYITDTGSNSIKRLDITTSKVITVAGGTVGTADGVGTSAQFNNPQGISISKDGKYLYIADTGNNRIRRLEKATNNVVTFQHTGKWVAETVSASTAFFIQSVLFVEPDDSDALFVFTSTKIAEIKFEGQYEYSVEDSVLLNATHLKVYRKGGFTNIGEFHFLQEFDLTKNLVKMPLRIKNEVKVFYGGVYIKDEIREGMFLSKILLSKTLNNFVPHPDLKYITYHKGYFFGFLEGTGEIRYSEKITPHYWNPNNFINIASNCTALLSTLFGLLVFTEYSTYILLGEIENNNYNIKLLDSQIGCIQGNATVIVDSYPVWISRSGLCTIQNGVVKNISNTFINEYIFSIPKYVKCLYSEGKLYILLYPKYIDDTALSIFSKYWKFGGQKVILVFEIINGNIRFYFIDVFSQAKEIITLAQIRNSFYVLGTLSDNKPYILYHDSKRGVTDILDKKISFNENLNPNFPVSIEKFTPYKFTSKVFTDGSPTSIKSYNYVFVSFRGVLKVTMFIDYKEIRTWDKIVDNSDVAEYTEIENRLGKEQVVRLSIPSEKQRGYSCYFKVEGKGVLYELRYELGVINAS